ncbi:unnamed protein product [Diatraea saccharalis]|uniref:Mannosyltransferase n=1 Tax=Diatraea saccharalis TaxID=40085 RepID=A0A9P0C4S4_9NEOP|nr:unnamed protein product [Diatraea saccharalis]
MALAKGLSPLHVLAAILVVRLVSVFLVRTWFVPDEYWQTLEVAHKQVFGYGSLTWEWQQGIRSYLYPALISVLYYVLKLTGLDYPEAVIILPRVFQAIFSGYADYCFYQWTGYRKWALYLVLTSWFWFYTCSRTLLQTVETSLLIIALSKFPFKDGKQSYYSKESFVWLWIAVLSVFIRPTSGPMWAVFGIYNLLTTKEGRLRLIVRTYVPIMLIAAGALISVDSYFYGRWIVTPWEFAKFNVINDFGSFYGVHPWYWYVSHGLVSVVGVNVLPLILSLVAVLRRPREHTVSMLLLAAVAVHIAVHSYISHKELKLLLPVVPLLLYVQQEFVVRWSRKAPKWQLYTFAAMILLGNATIAGYFGSIHQRGTLDVMPLVRDAAAERNDTTILFLMPCHSTPLYRLVINNNKINYENLRMNLDLK